MCACAERRVAFRDALAAVSKGDFAKARASAAFVATSAGVDLRAAAQAATRMAARARLAR